jgi:tetratricopeptide (TPR) repeat protein
VVATCVSNPSLRPEGAMTDRDGRFIISGLLIGKWEIQVLIGQQYAKTKEPVQVLPSSVVDAGDLTLGAMPAGMSAAPRGEADERNRRGAELQAKFHADIALGNFDDAIAKLTAIAKDTPKCAPCSAKIGEAQMKKGDLDAAEKSFLEAIEFDANFADAYMALASVYNSQKKFDDAVKMNSKATEIMTAKGGGAGPAALYNQGVALWNADKFAEAEAFFKKASEADPKMADAFFRLGMAQVNLGKIPDAIKSLEAFLALNPRGKDAEIAQAKAMLAAIK